MMRREFPTSRGEAWAGPLVVLGSVNMDFVTRQERLPRPGETIFGRGFEQVAGGKGLNQAVAAARAGGAVAFVGRVGNDDAGVALTALLADEGIDVQRVTVDPTRHTGIAQVSVLDDGDNAIVVIGGANDSDAWEPADEALVSRAAVLVAQLERPPSLVRRALETARRHGVPTVLTPAPVSDQASALLPLVDILVLNEHEAKALSGEPDPATAAGRLSEICPLVLLTRGAASTLVARHGSVVHEQPARRVAVVDTTGAGDCFAGSVIARLAAGDGLDEALRLATVAASLSVGRAGASRSMPAWPEVLEVALSRAERSAASPASP
jgi:ribokinase